MILWDRGRVRYLEGPAEEELERGKVDFELSGLQAARPLRARAPEEQSAKDKRSGCCFKKADALRRARSATGRGAAALGALGPHGRRARRRAAHRDASSRSARPSSARPQATVDADAWFRCCAPRGRAARRARLALRAEARRRATARQQGRARAPSLTTARHRNEPTLPGGRARGAGARARRAGARRRDRRVRRGGQAELPAPRAAHALEARTRRRRAMATCRSGSWSFDLLALGDPI